MYSSASAIALWSTELIVCFILQYPCRLERARERRERGRGGGGGRREVVAKEEIRGGEERDDISCCHKFRVFSFLEKS